MIDSASLQLQAAVVARLRSWPDLTNLVGTKIYDVVPADVSEPYVEIGDFDDRRDDKTCVKGRMIFGTLHVWSLAPSGSSRAEPNRIATAIEGALADADLTLTSYRLISLEHTQTQVFKDLDNARFHGVVEFIARTEMLS